MADDAPVAAESDIREQAAQHTLAANPLVGVRGEDILDSARLLLAQILRNPVAAAQQYLTFLGELGRIAAGASETSRPASVTPLPDRSGRNKPPPRSYNHWFSSCTWPKGSKLPEALTVVRLPSSIVSWSEASSRMLPNGAPFDAHGGASGYSMHTWSAIFVEMEVDEALGRARMRRCVAGYSAGRILNPRTARSQMIGGIIWGYGRAMLEESAMDPRYGRYLSKNLSGVMLPVNADIPADIDVFFVDEHDLHASKVGARGIGELGEVGVAAAITNAIYHATGKRIRKLPVHIADLVA